MGLIYLIDTNTLSEPVRPYPNEYVQERIQAATGMLAIAAITWHELLFGLFRMPQSRKRSVIEAYLFNSIAPKIPILVYDKSAAAWFARERARLTSIGRTPAYADGQIAAIAATNNLILVTRNTADFADYAGLSVENWFEDIH